MKKKVGIAPDSFKQTLSAIEVCEIISEVLKEKYPDIQTDSIPVADGGEGTVDAFLYALGGEKIYCTVKSPLGRDISAYYGVLPDGSAVIETAQAVGIGIEKINDPVKSGTYGLGQLILHAVKNGVKNIYIGLGGSATTDGGIGCLAALGVRFLDKNGESVPLCGEGLCEIESIDTDNIDKDVLGCNIAVLCDVKNPLYGKNGAAYIFSPQKGADENQVDFLDKGLENFADKTKDILGKDFSCGEGAGAAGGLGFALTAFLNAQLKSGIDTVLGLTCFEERIKNAQLIITGEGKMDSQSLMGKVPFSVARKCEGKRVVAVVGVSKVSLTDCRSYGISEVIETNPLHLPFEEIKHKASHMLCEACAKISL